MKNTKTIDLVLLSKTNKELKYGLEIIEKIKNAGYECLIFGVYLGWNLTDIIKYIRSKIK